MKKQLLALLLVPASLGAQEAAKETQPTEHSWWDWFSTEVAEPAGKEASQWAKWSGEKASEFGAWLSQATSDLWNASGEQLVKLKEFSKEKYPKIEEFAITNATAAYEAGRNTLGYASESTVEGIKLGSEYASSATQKLGEAANATMEAIKEHAPEVRDALIANATAAAQEAVRLAKVGARETKDFVEREGARMAAEDASMGADLASGLATLSEKAAAYLRSLEELHKKDAEEFQKLHAETLIRQAKEREEREKAETQKEAA